MLSGTSVALSATLSMAAARVVAPPMASQPGLELLGTLSMAQATLVQPPVEPPAAPPWTAYAQLLRSLLPPGQLWAAPAGSELAALLSRLATPFARIDAAGGSLRRESDPRHAEASLARWETLLGLSSEGSKDARRTAIIARLTGRGAQSREFYISLANTLGYSVTITEHRPFVAGSRAGEALSNDGWLWTWHVHATRQSVAGDAQLEQVFRAHCPAHTLQRFVWEE